MKQLEKQFSKHSTGAARLTNNISGCLDFLFYPSNVIIIKLYHAVTADNLWWLGNNFPVWHLETFWEMNAGELPEVTATVRGCGDCWMLQRLLEAAEDCLRGPQYDGKCSLYFNCYFSRTTPTNQDLRQKAVYFPIWQTLWNILKQCFSNYLMWRTGQFIIRINLF